MTTSSLLGSPVIQYFTEPADTISTAQDTVADYVHYVLID
jgi:hypothetical protein